MSRSAVSCAFGPCYAAAIHLVDNQTVNTHQMTRSLTARVQALARRSVAFLTVSLLPIVAWAQDPLGGGVVQGYAPPARDLPQTILNVINFVLVLVGVLALAFLVYGGFRYIASRGEDDEVQAAKSIITNAVIGIVVIGIAAAVVNFVIGAVLVGAR